MLIICPGYAISMVVTVETVYEGLLLSSVFLFAISLPKILLITSWSIYRTYAYTKMIRWKSTSKYFSKTITDMLSNPETRYATLVNEAAGLVKDLKRPGIEMLSALFFMWFSTTQLTVSGGASSLLWALMIAMIFVGLLALGHFITLAFKLMTLKGGVFG